MRIRIDGELFEIDSVFTGGYLPLIRCGRVEFYVARNSDMAAEATCEYWRDMAANDPQEFRCLVGEENLIRWALGQSAGPGGVQTNSLEEWIEMTGDYPEEQFAGYDGEERAVERCGILARELGWMPTLAYRAN